MKMEYILIKMINKLRNYKEERKFINWNKIYNIAYHNLPLYLNKLKIIL